MNEDRAAVPGYARPLVMVDFDDEIVEVVVALEPIAWFSGRAPERPIVAPIGGILAPGIGGTDPPHRQETARPQAPVCAPPKPHRMEQARRRAAVTLALSGADAAASERHNECIGAGPQPALRAPAGTGANPQAG